MISGRSRPVFHSLADIRGCVSGSRWWLVRVCVCVGVLECIFHFLCFFLLFSYRFWQFFVICVCFHFLRPLFVYFFPLFFHFFFFLHCFSSFSSRDSVVFSFLHSLLLFYFFSSFLSLTPSLTVTHLTQGSHHPSRNPQQEGDGASFSPSLYCIRGRVLSSTDPRLCRAGGSESGGVGGSLS